MQITRRYIISEIDKLISLGATALANEQKDANVIGLGDYLEGPNYKEFVSKIKVFAPRFLKDHPLYKDIEKLLTSFYPVSALETILQHLETIKADDFFLEKFDEIIEEKEKPKDSSH